MGRIALALASVLFVLLGLELALRVVTPTPEVANPLYSFHQSDPLLGWVGVPGIRQRFVRPEFAVRIEHSEEGFRRPDPAPPADAAARALFLGDSFTWGWGVAQGEVYTDHLQRAVAPRLAIVNRGVNSFGTSQEYLLLRRELERGTFDVVALLFVTNDVEDNVESKSGRRPWFELRDGRLVPHNAEPEPLMTPWRRLFKDSSRAFQWLDFRWNLLRRRLKAARRGDAPPAEARAAEAPVEIDFRTLHGFAETQQLLVEMQALAHRHGARFQLIYCPPAEEFLPGATPTAYDRAVRAGITDLVRRSGMPLLDLAPRFRAETQAGRALKFARDGHWNAEGHRVAADEILASGLLGARSTAQSSAATKP